MGGISVTTGAEFQASLTAYIAVRMLLGWPLNWLDGGADIPASVAGEVSGPGDDIRVLLQNGRSLEIQAKRTLSGKVDLVATVQKMLLEQHSIAHEHEIVLVVGGGTHSQIRDEFATDVRHFRADRHDRRRTMLTGLLDALPEAHSVLARLVVVPLDLDTPAHMGSQQAVDGLRQVLRAPEKAEAAWAMLVGESLKIGRGSQWDRADVQRVLKHAEYELRAVGPDAEWLDQLASVETLLKLWRPRTALSILKFVEQAIAGRSVGNAVRRKLFGLKARAVLWLGHPADACRLYEQALDFVPTEPPRDAEERLTWCHVQTNAGFGRLFIDDRDRAAAIARRVLEVDPTLGVTWALLVRATHGTSEAFAPNSVPSLMQQTPEVCHAAAAVAADEEKWDLVIRLLEPFVVSRSAPPDMLIDYCTALLMTDDGAEITSGKGTLAARTTSEEIERSSEIEFRRIRSTVRSEAKLQRSERVGRAVSEVIDTLANGEVDALLAKAYVCRARAREYLGQVDEARADDEEAARLSPSDPNVVLRHVEARLEARDDVGALALLTDAAVDGVPALLCRRAEVRFRAQDVTGATHDLERAVSNLGERAVGPRRGLYLQLGTVALDAGREDLAEQMRVALINGEPAGADWFVPVLEARIAALHRAWTVVEEAYTSALSRLDAMTRADLHLEVASVYLRASEDGRALRHLESAGASSCEHPRFESYVKALMREEAYQRVLELLPASGEDVRVSDPSLAALPVILLTAGAEVALLQGNLHRAATLADAAIEASNARDGKPDAHCLLYSAQVHIQLVSKQKHRARLARIVDQVLEQFTVDATTQLLMARYCVALGQSQRALELALRLYRENPDGLEFVGGLVEVAFASTMPRTDTANNDEEETLAEDELASSLTLETKTAMVGAATNGQDPTSGSTESGTIDDNTSASDQDDDDPDVGSDGRHGVVGPNTFVRLRADDGQRLDVFLYQDGPVSLDKGEFLVDDPNVSSWLGKRVGEAIVRTQGGRIQRFEIVRVVPAVVIVVRRLMRTYAARFPENPRFRLIHVGSNPTLRSLGPVLAELHQVRLRSERALEVYAEHSLPLGTLADVLGQRVIDVAREISAGAAPRLAVEGPPLADYDASVMNARTAATVVITRPALEYLELVGGWDLLSEDATLLAPRSMIDEWDAELAELEMQSTHGRITLLETAGRPSIVETTRHQAATALANSRELYERVLKAARVEFRSADALGRDERERRDALGVTSYDACALAKAAHATLYADDLGLRAVARAELQVQSFSTGALLEARLRADRIDQNAYDLAILGLLQRRHDMLPIRATTITAAYRRTDGGRLGDAVVDMLGDARVSAQSAAMVAADALHVLATSAIVTVSLERVCMRLVTALVAHRMVKDVIPFFEWAVKQRFQLLPRELSMLLSATRETLITHVTLSS